MKLVLAVLVALTLAACAPAAKPPTLAALQELPDLARLQTLFNQDAGKTRLVLLVAPT